MARSGLDVKYHKGIAAIEQANVILSLRVIDNSPCFKENKIARKQKKALSIVAHAPGPAPLECCAAAAIAVRVVQIIHVKICGLVLPNHEE
jgi:hypothetical protein